MANSRWSPVASDFTTTYRADGQPKLISRPDGNYTELTYDKLGGALGSDTDTSATPGAGTDRAVYAWTRNRAGQILTEAATVTGDASNGTVTYSYDPLGRLSSSALSGTTTSYGWDAVPNRTSVQVGAGTPATTTYDAADRPTSGANPTASYSNDADGRLTARPGQQLTWDHLGRITGVKDGSGTLLASYTYDPLDRLRLIDYGAGTRIRFRYVGLTTTVAQWLDDASGTVTRSVGTGWAGERLLDWTGSGSNIRIYGEDGHHDVTWLASNTGTVSASLRYDPWGTPRATVPTGYSPFRFQGAYTDDLRDTDNTNDLAWVITRWYAPTLGRFVSEDSLTGEPIDPPSRHLYAYGQGDPVGTWDPDGMKASRLSFVFPFPDVFCAGVVDARRIGRDVTAQAGQSCSPWWMVRSQRIVISLEECGLYLGICWFNSWFERKRWLPFHGDTGQFMQTRRVRFQIKKGWYRFHVVASATLITGPIRGTSYDHELN